jgi:hypothetical protein
MSVQPAGRTVDANAALPDQMSSKGVENMATDYTVIDAVRQPSATAQSRVRGRTSTARVENTLRRSLWWQNATLATPERDVALVALIALQSVVDHTGLRYRMNASENWLLK